jgi:hypothetical protein
MVNMSHLIRPQKKNKIRGHFYVMSLPHQVAEGAKHGVTILLI